MSNPKRQERRKALVERFGSDPDVLATIEEILEAEKEIVGTRRGQANTRLDRRRERRLWIERRDDLVGKLEARAQDIENAEQSKLTAYERRFPTVPLSTLINAAKVELQAANLYGAYYERLYSKFNPRWREEAIELLHVHDPMWFMTLDPKSEVHRQRLIWIHDLHDGLPTLDDELTRFYDSLGDAKPEPRSW